MLTVIYCLQLFQTGSLAYAGKAKPDLTITIQTLLRLLAGSVRTHGLQHSTLLKNLGFSPHPNTSPGIRSEMGRVHSAEIDFPDWPS